MLVLSRKCNEGIWIGEFGALQRACRITVLSIRGGRVKLGIEADPRTAIRRAEVVGRIRSGKEVGDSQ
jgi:carbon storage regulator CsrA